LPAHRLLICQGRRPTFRILAEALNAPAKRPVFDDGQKLRAGVERFGALTDVFLPFPFARRGLPALTLARVLFGLLAPLDDRGHDGLHRFHDDRDLRMRAPNGRGALNLSVPKKLVATTVQA
jgi:hypothetical protein